MKDRGATTTPLAADPGVSLNLNVRGLPRSATVAIHALSLKLADEGKNIFRLGLGQSPFPVPECVVQALRQNAHQKDYLPVEGLRPLREAVARYHTDSDAVDVHPDLVLVGPGSKELMFLLQVAFYGDLAAPSPCWVSYAPQAQIVGHRVTLLPTRFRDRWHLLPDRLEKLCKQDPGRPRVIILNYPGNPEGLTYSVDHLKEIALVARRYGVIILSDEIYGKLHHDGLHVSVARFYPEGTILSSGLSKWCGAGGWRLGTFVFPPKLRWLHDAMAALASETFTSTSAPIQYAAIRAFEGGQEIELYLAHARRVLRTLGLYCAARLREAGARVHDPEGAFYLFPDFSSLAAGLDRAGIATSDDLCTRALEDVGVAFLPGSAFGRPPEELTARIAYVDFNGAAALAASAAVPLTVALDRQFLQAHCMRTVEGINRLCDWLFSFRS